MKLCLVTILAMICVVTCAFAQETEKLEADLVRAADQGVDENQLRQIFEDHKALLAPEMLSDGFDCEGNTQCEPRYPLKILNSKRSFETAIRSLFNSPNPYDRILSYAALASSDSPSLRAELRLRLKSDKHDGAKGWAALALIYLKDSASDELFDFLVEHENFNDAHMTLEFLKLDRNLLLNTAYKRIGNDDTKAKILSAWIISVTEANSKTEALVRDAISNWDNDIKGYAVKAANDLKLGRLKSILLPLLEIPKLRGISLQALANSPTWEDRKYLISLSSNQTSVETDILRACFHSRYPEVVAEWLRIVREREIDIEYDFSVSEQPLLSSDKLLEEVKLTIRRTKNVFVLKELPSALSERTDKDSTDMLIKLLTHPDPRVRYWATYPLRGNRSQKLIAILPDLAKDPKIRTTGLVKLLVKNNVDNLQEVFENYLRPESQTSLNWQRSSFEHLSSFPNAKHVAIFRTALRNGGEDMYKSRYAAIGLGRLRDKASVELIIAAMENAYWKWDYLESLGRIRGEKARRAIESEFENEDKRIRLFVEELLKNW